MQHAPAGPVTGAGGSHTTSGASSQYSDSAASTPKRKFMEMTLQDGPICTSPQPPPLPTQAISLALTDNNTTNDIAGRAQLQEALQSRPEPASHAQQKLHVPVYVASRKNFISPELRKSCALTDLAVHCNSESPGQFCLPAVTECSEPATDHAHLLSSGSAVLQQTSRESPSAMDTSSASESGETGDENEAPLSGLTIPESRTHGLYGSVESDVYSKEAAPESSYESPRSMLLTPGARPPPPLSAEQLAVLREGSVRLTRSLQEDTPVSTMHAQSPDLPVDWADGEGRHQWEGSPCMRASSQSAPDEHGSSAAVKNAEQAEASQACCTGGDDDEASACGTTDSASWQSHAPGSGACIASDSICSGTVSGCTDCDSPVEAVSSQENHCPNVGQSTALDVIPDTPTSSEEDDCEAPRVQQDAQHLNESPAEMAEGSDGFAAAGDAVAYVSGGCGMLAPVRTRLPCRFTAAVREVCCETSNSLTSDELNTWKAQNCTADLVQVRA